MLFFVRNKFDVADVGCMDIARLPSAPAGSAGAASSTCAPVTAASAAAAFARAPLEAGDGSDRVERSEELASAILEQKDGLARLAPPPQERIDEIRAGLADADSVSRSSFETAASGLLRGEPFFAPASPGA
jgi:hypothetical protein